MLAKVIGYTRDHRGNVVARHIRDIALTLCPGNLGGCRNTSQYILTTKPQTHMDKENEYRYRIRKLTPRECFRLMDVPEEAIDLIQAAKVIQANGTEKPAVSKSQQYKLAGNSIVVACLYGIFYKLLIDKPAPKPRQLTIFDML